jgi:hypothetical protein
MVDMRNNSITAITHSDDIRYTTFIMVGDDYRLCGFTIDMLDVNILHINGILALLVKALHDKNGRIHVMRDKGLATFLTPSYMIPITIEVRCPKTGYLGYSIVKLNSDVIFKMGQALEVIRRRYKSTHLLEMHDE